MSDTASPLHAGTQPPNDVKVDYAQMKSSYCNVCSASLTREEVILNFGLNKNWDMGDKAMEVELHHRIILNPHAARRLRALLGDLLDEHERRYGGKA